ncbi:MAG TPA: hypothetical protein VGH44_04225 [Candidatus Saccharimonadia bacterium]|jgi:hypothetical protein
MKRLLVSLGVAVAVATCTLPVVVSASNTLPGSGGGTSTSGGGSSLTDPNSGGCAGGVQIALPIFSNNTCVQNSQGNGSAIVVYLKEVLQLLSGIVGITIITLIIWAGIRYITSLGDPSIVKDAKSRLTNAITALVLFLMMFAILQFLVPGGLL